MDVYDMDGFIILPGTSSTLAFENGYPESGFLRRKAQILLHPGGKLVSAQWPGDVTMKSWGVWGDG